MELKINLGYKELLALVKQLPASQIAKLKSELSSKLIEEKSKKEMKQFQELLLNGPKMSEEQYEQFKANRKHFGKWRKN